METARENVPPLGSLKADYAPLVSTCRAFGFGKTRAYELAREGSLRTCRIGGRRMVYLDSLRSLPERLAASGGGE